MVSTTLGAEGLPVKDNEHLLIADTAQDFANAIIKLINNKELASRLALNSYDLVKQQFGLERLATEASQILDRVANP
jgi:glycosyltransferase involved in cell wall biosynthesis